QEAHGVFRAAVDFGVALLTPEPLYFGDGEPVHADRGQGVADLVELKGLDDGHHDFHGLSPDWARFHSGGGRAISTHVPREVGRPPSNVAAASRLKMRARC